HGRHSALQPRTPAAPGRGEGARAGQRRPFVQRGAVGASAEQAATELGGVDGDGGQMSRLLLLMAALLALSSAGPFGQEFSLFDLNDFVDPRQLGAVPASFGRFGCPCKTVVVVRALAGWDHDFMNVTEATRTDAGFGQIAASVYRGPWQLNVKAAAMR